VLSPHAHIIHQIGVTSHIKGYYCLREAIILSVNKRTILNSVTKLLYPTIAKGLETTPSRVERAIIQATEVAWDKGDIDVFNFYFGYTKQSMPIKITSELLNLLYNETVLTINNKHIYKIIKLISKYMSENFFKKVGQFILQSFCILQNSIFIENQLNL
jgi:hypothetical protein